MKQAGYATKLLKKYCQKFEISYTLNSRKEKTYYRKKEPMAPEEV